MNTIIGGTYAASNYNEDTISANNTNPERHLENKTKRIIYNFSSTYNSKLNSKLFVKAGVQAELMNLNLFFRTREVNPAWKQIWDFNDYTTLAQAFVHAKYNFSDKLTLNIGLHSQLLTLNNSKSIEPRVGLKYAATAKSTFSAGYGLHSQMQPTDVYFYRALKTDGSYDQSNRDLNFTRSHHFALGYEVLPSKDWRLKTEVYYQYLFNVPVTITPSSFSMLNTGSSFNPNDVGYLENTGKGTNYGAELTIEKFFSKGYYGLLTGSIYESKYKGSDDIERNTAFNGRYVYNILLGKEIKLGKARNSFTVDAKMTQAGGRYFTPVDLAASLASHEQVLKGDAYAFSEKMRTFSGSISKLVL